VQADHARAQLLIATPGTSGDQLLFFYDATAGHAPFLVVSNLAPAAVTLEVAWYSQNLNQRLATQFLPLAIGANVILDPSLVQGVTGNAGITVVTPVMSATDARPVVPPPLNDTLPSAPSGSLAGGFTLADTSTNSAFGQNPLARVAVDAAGNRAPAGAIVDGTAILYQRIAPDALIIPFYFNPNGSTPLANRAILGAFEDRYAASGFSIGPVALNLGVAFVDATGNDAGSGTLPVSGVAFADVQSLAGATPLTSSGKAILGVNTPLPANANLLGLMSQSLGTFAVGQGLPGYFTDRGQQDRLVDNGDGTVTDRQTGLQWEQKTTDVGSGANLSDPHDVDNRYSWSITAGPDGTVFTFFLAGLNHGATGVGNCAGDGSTQVGGFAGHCDWRLPTIVELRTILDTTVSGCGSGTACINPIFGPTAATGNSDVYWSATTSAADNNFVATVNFSDGSVPSVTKFSTLGTFARAVRGGK
jgi:hypothetical protein